MKLYRHPESHRPPLRYGGHEWLPHAPAAGDWLRVAQCVRCGATVPYWSLVERLWPGFAPAVCPAKVAALTPAGDVS